MLSSRFFCTTLLLAALAPRSVADILTVGPTGSGSQFTQIQAAVNAAADDDVILVKAGSYNAFLVTKPVRILKDGTGNVFIPNCEIRDLASGEEMVLSGVFPQPPGITPIVLRDCAGTVVLHDVQMSLSGEGLVGVRIESCERAVVLGSRIRNAGVFGANRGGALSVVDSEVWIANTEISGTDDCCFATRASHAIESVNSTLHVWRSQIRGGRASSKQDREIADGGIGIRAVASTVNLFGGPTALVEGGEGYEGVFGPPFPGGPGMELTQGSTARIQQDMPLSGGFHGDGLSQAEDVVLDGTSSFTLDPKVFPTLASSAQRVQIGATFSLTLEGNPGGYQVLWLSLRTGPTTTFRGVDGFGLLDKTQIFKVASEVLPPSAAHTLNFHVPSQTALLGSTLFFQAVERFSPAFAPRSAAAVNQYAIGNPVLVTVTN